MPTYEYRCGAGHQYEKRESFSASSRQKCEVCGKPADRVLFAPPIVFKGAGFYVTDSRNGKSASGGASGESKAETPPRAAPEATESSAAS